jgi:hypothetical protein
MADSNEDDNDIIQEAWKEAKKMAELMKVEKEKENGRGREAVSADNVIQLGLHYKEPGEWILHALVESDDDDMALGIGTERFSEYEKASKRFDELCNKYLLYPKETWMEAVQAGSSDFHGRTKRLLPKQID